LKRSLKEIKLSPTVVSVAKVVSALQRFLLLNQLVGTQQKRLRDGDAESFEFSH